MYTQFAIRRFRGLNNVALERLSRINLLVGANGAGKTSFLEALWLHANPSGELVARIDAFRAYAWETPIPGAAMTPWRYLFYGSRTNADIELLGRANGHRWQVNLRQVSDGYQETPIPALAKSNGSFLASGEGTLAMLLNPLNVSAAAELLVEVTNKDRPSAEPVRLATLRSSAQGLGLHTQHPLRGRQ